MLKCCLCGDDIREVNGWDKGHNAEPIEAGRCCNVCNNDKVLPARIRLFQNSLKLIQDWE
jgi:hypothetical protein